MSIRTLANVLRLHGTFLELSLNCLEIYDGIWQFTLRFWSAIKGKTVARNWGSTGCKRIGSDALTEIYDWVKSYSFQPISVLRKTFTFAYTFAKWMPWKLRFRCVNDERNWTTLNTDVINNNLLSSLLF